MIPNSTRWNRNHTKISEYYFKWEIDVMRKPESVYDVEAASTIIPLPTLHFMENVKE